MPRLKILMILVFWFVVIFFLAYFMFGSLQNFYAHSTTETEALTEIQQNRK
jgi:uncharacterized membrane protein